MKEARLERLHTVRVHLYEILDKAKLQGHKTNQWLLGRRVGGEENKREFFFWLHHVACGILMPWLRIEPVPPAFGAWCLNHWTTKEVPRGNFFRVIKLLYILIVLMITWVYPFVKIHRKGKISLFLNNILITLTIKYNKIIFKKQMTNWAKICLTCGTAKGLFNIYKLL